MRRSSMFDKIKKCFEPSKLPCGCYHDKYWFITHDVYDCSKGKKRWKEIVCDKTGKFWKIPKPDLKEIK